jgi:Anti-sigma-K factor rskA, C-terminal
MTHLTDEVLAALALGDSDVDAADRQHAQTCPLCSEEVAELASVHGLLREEVGMRASHRVDPGPGVWQRVLAGTLDDVPAPVEESTAVDALLVEGPADSVPSRSLGPSASSPPPSEPSERPPVSSLAGRRAKRQNRSWWLAGVAAASLLIGVLVGRAVWAPGETTQPVVAAVPLTTLDASKQQEGTAKLLGNQGSQGEELRVDTQPMSPGSGYVEVWLLNTDGKRMVSLGVLSGTQATFPVPPDAIAQGYTIVDLSREQYDDRPQHSGDSIMRGTLPV